MPSCPGDQTLLITSNAEGHAGMRCGTCAGMWLPYAYIDSLRHDRRFDPDRFKQKLQEGAAGTHGKRCPSGCGELNATVLQNVQLDWCPTCQGVWFDAGELERVLEAHPRIGSLKGSEDAWLALHSGLLILSIFP